MPPTRTVYLDHAATTPVDPRVLEAMLPYFSEVYGNPSSIHRFGRMAEQAVEDARETVARVWGCQPSEVVFTSCGSESDNLALRGAMLTARRDGRGRHLVTTPIEHSAVSKTAGRTGIFFMSGVRELIAPTVADDSTQAIHETRRKRATCPP